MASGARDARDHPQNLFTLISLDLEGVGVLTNSR